MTQCKYYDCGFCCAPDDVITNSTIFSGLCTEPENCPYPKLQMTEPLSYKLDTNKIQTLEDVRNVFECMNLVSSANETHEQSELLKKYFTIPCVPKPVKLNFGDLKND